jgi:hypothetical protein
MRPHTNLLLKVTEYHHCCQSNLTRALATERNLLLEEAEFHINDVMNIFMCSGYTRDTHLYFMKASPVRPGDFIEFVAEIDLLVALSACPGGDSGASHSDDGAEGAEEPHQEQPSKEPREHADRRRSRPAGDPPLAIERDAAARHDNVCVRVMGERSLCRRGDRLGRRGRPSSR